MDTLTSKILKFSKKNLLWQILFLTYISVPILWLCMLHPYVMQYPSSHSSVVFAGLAQYYVMWPWSSYRPFVIHEKNEFFGIWDTVGGGNFIAYRQQHIDHHKSASFQEDPDAHIYKGVIQKGFSEIYLTLGTLIEIAVKIRQKGSGGVGSEKELMNHSKIWNGFVIGHFAQLCIMFLSQQIFVQYLQFYDLSYPPLIVESFRTIGISIHDCGWRCGVPRPRPISCVQLLDMRYLIIPLLASPHSSTVRIVIEHCLCWKRMTGQTHNTRRTRNSEDNDGESDRKMRKTSTFPKEAFKIWHHTSKQNLEQTKSIQSTMMNPEKGPKIPTLILLHPSGNN